MSNLGCGCGGAGKNGSPGLEYVVKTSEGETVVGSKQEARLLIAAEGGGTYKARARKKV